MDKHLRRWLAGMGLVLGIGFTINVFAGHCPKNLHQDDKGYWTSNDQPGWKSHRPTSPTVTLEAKDFGGAVYSPLKKRIACVYKASDGKWVALLSSVYHPFNQDDLKAQEGKNSPWEYNQQHKDWVCGTPKHKLEDCQFDIKQP